MMILLNILYLAKTLAVSVNLEAPLAYIDPGTGGMLFQVLAVMFAAFSGFLFLFSRQIRTYFASFRRRMRGEPEPVEDVSEDIPDDGGDVDAEV